MGSFTHKVFVVLMVAVGSHAFAPSALPSMSVRRTTSARLRSLPVMQAENSQMSRRNLFLAAAGLAAGNVLPQPVFAAGGDKAIFKIKTYNGVEGEVEITLFPDKAPKTVEGFKKLASDGLYDGTAFHRVGNFLKKSVLIGGDPFTKEEPYCLSVESYKGQQVCSEGAGYGKDGYFSSRLANSNDDSKKTRGLWDKGGPDGWRRDSLSKYKLEPEFNTIPHERGVITMRRFYRPDSAGSQFIICLADMTKELDGHYAAFGKVTKGIELLDEISKVETFKSPSPLQFLRDDKVPAAVWGAWDLPVQRQGVEKVTIE
mmetsp:Transcript_12875/g.20239  ORF Transcript_12875/g.20239 Transcript_12875/m.20239 type:complete len:315 (+) Transcript_12875:61-1005(+)